MISYDHQKCWHIVPIGEKYHFSTLLLVQSNYHIQFSGVYRSLFMHNYHDASLTAIEGEWTLKMVMKYNNMLKMSGHSKMLKMNLLHFRDWSLFT